MQKYLIPIIFVLLNVFLVFKLVSIYYDISEINKEKTKEIEKIHKMCIPDNCVNFPEGIGVKLSNETANLHKKDIYEKEATPLFLLVVSDLFLSTFFIKRTYKKVIFVFRMLSIVAVSVFALFFFLYKILPNFL